MDKPKQKTYSFEYSCPSLSEYPFTKTFVATSQEDAELQMIAFIGKHEQHVTSWEPIK